MYEKTKNPLAKLGWLGLLGVLGVSIFAPWLMSFLPFFFFFTYRNVIPDELFWTNVGKAAIKAFIVYIIFTTVAFCFFAFRATFIYHFTPEMVVRMDNMVQLDFEYYLQHLLLSAVPVFSFIITLCTFFFSLMYYRRKEKKLLGEELC